MDVESGSNHRSLLSDSSHSTSYQATSERADRSNTFVSKLNTAPRWVKFVLAAIVILLFAVIVGLIAMAITRKEDETSNSNGSSSTTSRSAAEIAACMASYAVDPHHPLVASPRSADGQTPAIILQNTTLHDGINSVQTGVDLLLEGSVIKQIGRGITQAGATIIDVQGRHVTPGLVDMHSHIGVYAWPFDIWATQDGNELTDPIFPQLRALDAYNTADRAIDWILQGGTVTSQVLPGSGNAMGGEGLVVKHNTSTYVHDVLVPNAPRLLKMACGENPKRVYGLGRGVTPASRMGNAWVMRAAFESARNQISLQQSWCAQTNPTTPFPDPLSLHSLVGLLQQQIRLHTHCYMTHDFQMMLRLAEEFNFTIHAFHHASEAWKIPNLLKNITVATWADWGLFKFESYDGSTLAPAILDSNNVAVCIKSDDDVVSRYLAFEAAKAHAYGLPYDRAIAAITSIPAKAMGLEQRLGSIQVGLDADIVVWNLDPLVLGAVPDKVIVNGVVKIERGGAGPPPPFPSVAAPLSCSPNSPQQTLSCYKIVAANIYQLLTPGDIPPFSGEVLVINGTISCVSSSCPIPPSTPCSVFSVNQSSLTPGFVEAGSHIGQMEIDSEDATRDGYNTGSGGVDGGFSVIQAIDGIHTHGKHMNSSRKAGVLSIINPPLVVGLSTMFHSASFTNNGTVSVFLDGTSTQSLIQQRVSLHLSIGNSAKTTGLSGSISGQLAQLRALFEKASALILSNSSAPGISDPNWAFYMVLKGYLPVSVDVNGADEIAALVRLQTYYQFRMIIQGGAEAHLLANQLAQTNPAISVILTSRVPPSSFETRRASDTAYSILRAAGVPVAVQAANVDNARNLRWEAGWQKVFNNLTTTAALGAISADVVRIFGISGDIDSGTPARGQTTAWIPGLGQIQQGTLANLVLFNGDPLGVESTVQLVALGMDVECRPQQY